METILIEMTSLGSVAITVFGAAFCLMQTRHSKVSRSFAIFLIAIAVNNLPEAFAQVFASLPPAYTSIAGLITWPSSFLLAPLFWLYVVLLTSNDQHSLPHLGKHLAVPAASVVITVLALAGPANLRDTLFSDDPVLDTPWAITLAGLLAVLQLAVFPQIALYLILILRRLARFRLKLRDYYSSTEQHELRWIYVIGGLGFAFWLSMALLLLAALAFEDALPSIDIAASVVGFALVSALTLWGIRQNPPLAPEDPQDPVDPIPTAVQPAAKYEKSALSSEASDRLSRKLRSAMEIDHLHRDANLSLWALARHTGASSNYISQTLNEVIGESFFDFVNSYRIAEAKTLLATTNESVLNITYDVGFNARSSFYNAFKRHTGQTPTSYRKKMSQRDGMDDIKAPVNEV